MAPSTKQDKVPVACPHCGHEQLEPRTAISTVCKKCRGHFQVQDVLNPKQKKAEAAPRHKRITCFECGAELAVPESAQSTMCKKCSRYVDLKDYNITNTVSKNFKTKGSFTLEPTGYVFNTETFAASAVIKGRFLGKLTTEGPLTIYSSAEIKGSFKAGQLVIPAGNKFAWKDPLKVGAADIAGELVADLVSEGTIVLRSTARLFGDLESRNLIVEAGAVVVGRIKLGPAAASTTGGQAGDVEPRQDAEKVGARLRESQQGAKGKSRS